MRNVLTFIMAGGKGERLFPLTKDRAKPAVPFGGIYRIIDFTLSNCINSGIRKIHVLIQYKSFSLQRHLLMGWNIFDSELGEYIDVIPAQQRVDAHWYLGTADAVYQNIYSIEQERPEYVLVLAGDHVYKMNYAQMLAFHQQSGADATVSVIEFEQERAMGFGIVEVDERQRIIGFEEKPRTPKTIPGSAAMRRVHGDLSLHPRRTGRGVNGRCEAHRQHARFRPGRHPVDVHALQGDGVHLPPHPRLALAVPITSGGRIPARHESRGAGGRRR